MQCIQCLSLQICECSLMSVIQHNTTRHFVTTAEKITRLLTNILLPPQTTITENDKLLTIIRLACSGLAFCHARFYTYETSITLTLPTVQQRKEFNSEKNRYFQQTIAFNRYHSSYSASYRPTYFAPLELVCNEVCTEKGVG